MNFLNYKLSLSFFISLLLYPLLFISFSSLICLSSKKLLLKLVISWPWFGGFLYLASNYFRFVFSFASLDDVVKSWVCVFLVPLPSAVIPSSVTGRPNFNSNGYFHCHQGNLIFLSAFLPAPEASAKCLYD